MRKKIKYYLNLDEKDKNKLLKNATFIFDTNVLLNLYRYSERTRESLKKAMIKSNGRIWIPNQVAIEFMKNRYEVIDESNDRFQKMDKEKNSLIKQYAEMLRLNNQDEEIRSLDSYISNWIEESKNKNTIVNSFHDDSVIDFLLELFDQKAGESYSKDTLVEIKKTASERYAKDIPPGYKDKLKHDDKQYGDYIIWRQMLDFAKKEKRDIIFITLDQKEDWWEIYRGKVVGPRRELREEFELQTEMDFHMYTTDQFLKYYTDKIDQDIIDEVIVIGKEQRRKSKESNSVSISNKVLKLETGIEKRKKVIQNLSEKYANQRMPNNIKEQINNIKKNIEKRINELEKLYIKMD